MRTVIQVTVCFGLVVAVYASVRWGGTLLGRVERAVGIERATGGAAADGGPTPELAEETLDRFERLRSGQGGDRIALSGTQLTSVLRYAIPGIVPPGIAEPTVALEAGGVRLSARVAVGAFPHLPELGEVVGLLPDTVLVDLQGELHPHDQRHLALLVGSVHVATVPLPKRMIRAVLDGLGRDAAAGLPGDALRVPLPDGLERAYVERDSLVLIARPEPVGETSAAHD